MNRHDPDAMAALIAAEYRSEQPVHPNRGFGGAGQVRENWSSVFEGVPDFSAELISAASNENSVWGEWRWYGAYSDGSPFEMRGVTVFGVRGEQIVSGRLYMEPVEQDGGDIGESVQELYRPPSG
jgi:hypothetical protein